MISKIFVSLSLLFKSLPSFVPKYFTQNLHSSANSPEVADLEWPSDSGVGERIYRFIFIRKIKGILLKYYSMKQYMDLEAIQAIFSFNQSQFFSQSHDDGDKSQNEQDKQAMLKMFLSQICLSKPCDTLASFQQRSL